MRLKNDGLLSGSTDRVDRFPDPCTGSPPPSPGSDGKTRFFSLSFSGSASLFSGDYQSSVSQLLQSNRLNQVGSAVRAKLGQTISWQRGSSTSLNNSNNDQIVAQAKSLCGRYLRSRMRDAPLAVQKKLSFQRLKSVSNMAATEDPVPDVLDEIRLLCRHLEVTNPELFGSLVVNVGLRSLPSSERAVKSLLTAVVAELFTGGEVSWGRLAAMFAVTGALALDCVRANKPELVLGLVETTGRNVDRHAASWIAQQGGWESLTSCFRHKSGYSSSAIASFFLVVVCCSCVGIFTAHFLSVQLQVHQTFLPAVS